MKVLDLRTSGWAMAFSLLGSTLHAIPRPDHVVIVIEENRSDDQILGSGSACCPYLNSLALSGAKMTQSYAMTHPSQPNYIHLFSGMNQGVIDNSCPNAFTGTDNLASALIGGGFSFGGYSEDLPSVGDLTCTTGGSGYWRKHNPWVNWQEGGALSPAVNMPFAGYFPLGPDYSSLPTVSIVVPNQANDMHDGSQAQGDSWLQANLEGYRQWALTHNSLLIIDFDEDDSSAGNNNRIPTIFVGPMVCPGSYGVSITHHSVLRTLLDMYGLAPFNGAVAAAPVTDIFACITPTSTETSSPTSTDTATPTRTPTLSETPTMTLTPTDPPTLTETPSQTPTATETSTQSQTASDTSTPTLTPTVTATVTLSFTATPTRIPGGRLKIYPNPITGTPILNVRVPISGTADIEIKLFSVSYRRVLVKSFKGAQPGVDLQVELKDASEKPLANGLYHLRAISGEERWAEKLLIFR